MSIIQQEEFLKRVNSLNEEINSLEKTKKKKEKRKKKKLQIKTYPKKLITLLVSLVFCLSIFFISFLMSVKEIVDYSALREIDKIDNSYGNKIISETPVIARLNFLYENFAFFITVSSIILVLTLIYFFYKSKKKYAFKKINIKDNGVTKFLLKPNFFEKEKNHD